MTSPDSACCPVSMSPRFPFDVAPIFWVRLTGNVAQLLDERNETFVDRVKLVPHDMLVPEMPLVVKHGPTHPANLRQHLIHGGTKFHELPLMRAFGQLLGQVFDNAQARRGPDDQSQKSERQNHTLEPAVK